MHAPILLIVSAPSGAGKTSLIQRLLQTQPDTHLAISYTTRSPREGEVHGRDYHFVPDAQFQSMIAAEAFAEYAEVHRHFYGTPKDELETYTRAKHDVIAEVDWQGAQNIRKLYPAAVSLFIMPPSLAALHTRLIARGKDSAEVIARRVAQAGTEIAHAIDFDFVLVNDDFEQSFQALQHIYAAAHYLRKSNAAGQLSKVE